MKHISRVDVPRPAEMLSHPVPIILEHLMIWRRSPYMIPINDLLTIERALRAKAQSLGSQ